MLIDTHVHLNDRRYEGRVGDIVAAFPAQGLEAVVNVSYDRESSEAAVRQAAEYTAVYAAVGVHPHDSKSFTDADGDYFLAQCRENPKVVAIGEIGLDYHYDHSPRDVQREIFVRQIELAFNAKKPVILHLREAAGEMLEILKENKSRLGCGFVLHCFSESKEYAREALNLGAHISFAGPVTFKNAVKTVEVAAYVPDDRFFAETDCPYLTPEPFRGQLNEPKNVRYVAQKIAAIRGTDLEALTELTTANAKRFFGIK